MVAKHGDSRAIVSDNFGILLSKAGGSEEESTKDGGEEFFHGCLLRLGKVQWPEDLSHVV